MLFNETIIDSHGLKLEVKQHYMHWVKSHRLKHCKMATPLTINNKTKLNHLWKRSAFNKCMPTFAFNNMHQDICWCRISPSDCWNALIHYILTITAQKFNSFLCCLAESPFTRRILQRSLTNMYSVHCCNYTLRVVSLEIFGGEFPEIYSNLSRKFLEICYRIIFTLYI